LKFSSNLKDEKIIQFGPIQAIEEVKKNNPLPPVSGSIVLAGGIDLIIIGVRSPGSEQLTLAYYGRSSSCS
jgi:hypothetical protein